MNELLEGLRAVFDTFGANVFVPVMIFVVALILKVDAKKAFLSGLYAGVGLVGFSMVLGSYSGMIAPIVQSMVDNAGINLPIVDVGWQATAVVAYSTEAGMYFLLIALILQTALFFLKWTNIFQPSDLWNNYSYMAWGSMVYYVTKSMMLAIALMILLNLYSLLVSELMARRWSTYYKYPNCTIIPLHNVEPALFGIVIDPVWNAIGLDKVRINPQTLQKKLGFLGEPITLGLILGIILGVLGNTTRLGTLAAWGEISKIAIATAAVMAIFPRIAGLFAQAFAPISQAASKSVREGAKNNEWYLAVNDATGYGEPATLISGILLIPLVLVVAFVSTKFGNQTLPILDLLAIPYMIQGLVCLTNGNITKVLINGVIWFGLGLFMCTATAETFTEVARTAGFALPAGALMITSFNILGKPVFGLVFLAFLSQNPIYIAIVTIAYFVVYFAFRLNRTKVYDYLDRAAARNTAELS